MQMSEKRIDLAKSMPKPIDNQVPELNVWWFFIYVKCYHTDQMWSIYPVLAV